MKKEIFKRSIKNPIIKPDSNNDYENLVTCNPACIYHNSIFYLFYRAAGNDYEHHINICLATSDNGIDFVKVPNNPILPYVEGMDSGGLEDPRIVKIGDAFIITYAYRPFPPGQYWKNILKPIDYFKCPKDAPNFFKENMSATALIISSDLQSFKRLGRITDDKYDNRDVIIFPKIINNNYVRLERPCKYKGTVDTIWINYSKDLLNWGEPKLLCLPKETWEETKIGGSTPPIETKDGWLAFYHGVDKNNAYRVGALLLDIDNPEKILYRTTKPIFEPEADYEKCGMVNEVVFPTGCVLKEDILYLYYGAGDQYCAVATANLSDVIDFIKNN